MWWIIKLKNLFAFKICVSADPNLDRDAQTACLRDTLRFSVYKKKKKKMQAISR
jgi:hypothetical protein